MKERVRLSGLFPRVRNQPMSNQLQALMKEFQNNAALTGILERRRRLEERMQFELKGTEGMDALNRNLAPPFRAGLANAATSASVADRLARSRVAGQLAAAVAANRIPPAAQVPPAAAAEDVMTGGTYSVGGSSGSGAVVAPGSPAVPAVAPGTPAGAKKGRRQRPAPGTPADLPATPGQRRRIPKTPPASSSQA